MALADARQSPLYVFYDNNQALYQRPSNIPVRPEDEYELTINCRNTRPIHEAAYHYDQGVPTDPPEIEGVAVQSHRALGLTQQVRTVSGVVTSGSKMVESRLRKSLCLW